MNKGIGFAVASIVVLVMTTFGLFAKDNIDLSRDDLDTIKYVGQEYIKSAVPKSTFSGKDIHFESPKVNWFSSGKKKSANGKGEIQEGGYNAVFRVGDGPLQIRKLQLAKKNGKWQVVNELSEKQIHAAHLQAAPFRNKPPYIFKAIVARHFEKHFYTQEGGWEKIKEPLFPSCRGGDREGKKGYCEVAYGIYYKGDYKINGSFQHTRCSVKTYLFKQKGGKWVIEKVLPANKKFNRKTNEIIDRKGDVWGC